MKVKKSAPHRSRPAFALLITMLALLVVVSLLGTLLDSTRTRHAGLGLRRQVRQADVLLTAGRDLAARRLADTADYRGEVWETELPGEETARVEVSLRGGSEATPRRLKVSVVLEKSGTEAVRRSASFALRDPRAPTNQED